MTKDHYVSQFYIKQFSHRNDKKVYRYRISNKYNPIKLVDSCEICYRKGLFTISENGEIDNSVEDRFGQQEKQFLPFIRELNEASVLARKGKEIKIPLNIFQNLKSNIIHFTFFQLKRSLAVNPVLRDFTRKEIMRIQNIVHKEGIIAEPIANMEGKIIINITRTILQRDVLFEALNTKNFELIFNTNPNNDFILSDFPIYVDQGLKHNNSELTIPLGKYVCARFFGSGSGFNKLLTRNKKLIEDINIKTMTNAYEYIICAKRTQLIELMKTHKTNTFNKSFNIDFNKLNKELDMPIKNLIKQHKK